MWDLHLKPFNVINCGIGGDRAQNILWRVDNLSLPDFILTAVLLIGTNNMDCDKPGDIASSIMSSAAKLREKYPQLHVVIIGVLPRGLHVSSLRDKIRHTNVLLESQCKKMPCLTFVEQSSRWTKDSGQLNEVLFHTDFLHLIKPGNEILARQLASVLVSLNGRDTRIVTKYPVCRQPIYPPLPLASCAYIPPPIPSPSPTIAFHHHPCHRRRKYHRAHPSTSPPVHPTGSSSTSPPIPVSSSLSPSSSLPPSPSPSSRKSTSFLNKKGNGGRAFLLLRSFLLSHLLFILFSFLSISAFLMGCGFYHNVRGKEGGFMRDNCRQGKFLVGNCSLHREGNVISSMSVTWKIGSNWTGQQYNVKETFILVLCKTFYKFLFLYTFSVFYICNLTSIKINCRYNSKILKLIKKKRRRRYPMRIKYILLKVTIFSFFSLLNELHHDHNSRLKCFIGHSKRLFDLNVINISNRIIKKCQFDNFRNKSLMHIKVKNNGSFYKHLLLLSGDIEVNPGPVQFLPTAQKGIPNTQDKNGLEKFEMFGKRGLHFIHVNINSILPKIEEIRYIALSINLSIIGI